MAFEKGDRGFMGSVLLGRGLGRGAGVGGDECRVDGWCEPINVFKERHE